MAKRKIEDIVMEIAAQITEGYQVELVDVEYVKEGANWYLRVYIDKEGGINIDDCELVSRKLDKILDKIDIIKQSYTLEVSSPGLERPLKSERDFKKYAGEMVEIKLFKPYDGKKLFEGELAGLIDGKVVIKADEDRTIEFDMSNVAVVKRSVNFKTK